MSSGIFGVDLDVIVTKVTAPCSAITTAITHTDIDDYGVIFEIVTSSIAIVDSVVIRESRGSLKCSL